MGVLTPHSADSKHSTHWPSPKQWSLEWPFWHSKSKLHATQSPLSQIGLKGSKQWLSTLHSLHPIPGLQ